MKNSVCVNFIVFLCLHVKGGQDHEKIDGQDCKLFEISGDNDHNNYTSLQAEDIAAVN